MHLLNSIKRRLIALHLLAVAAVAVALPFALLWRLDSIARELHQRALREQAEQIAEHLHRAPGGAVELDLPDEVRQLYSQGYARYGFAVLTASGRVLLSSRGPGEALFRADPLGKEPSYFERRIGSANYFGVSMPLKIEGEPLWIQVSQDLAHRDVLIDDIVDDFLPKVAWVVLPVMLGLLGIDLLIFRRTLRPLEDASALAGRIGPNRTDLRLPEASMPRDVLPLVRAINQALDRLEQALVTQREFVADAAHELRTPLAILRAQVEALPDSPMVPDLLADIEAMTRIVNQLIGVAESDTLTLQPHEVADLRAVAVDAVEFMAPVALAWGKNVAVAGDDGPILVQGNAAALFQAMRNLIENGINHTPPGTTVEVALAADGTAVVRDEGCGIPPEQRELVFQRFWRGDRSCTGGAGLGLAIVARIVRAYGGSVRIEDAPVRGASFALSLPLAVPAPECPSGAAQNWA
ncbi:MAG: sensor histidine kinase N-terminal domain-containing protein [Acetobacteraceae bacterium]|nr:sensor histidine kinase N-terminal domain-containing protein [Acetobacteraceae bacterium]